MHSRVSRLLRTARDPARLAGLLPEALYVVAMAFSFLLSKVPLLTPDSGGYLRRGEAYGESSAAGFVGTSWGDINFLGHSFRSWPTALLYAVVPAGDAPLGSWGRVFLQTVLAMIVTIWLARELGRLMPGRPGLIIRSITYLLALTPSALVYTFVIGAEGPAYILSLATCAMALGMARWIKPDTPLRTGFIVVSLVWLLGLMAMIVRPSAAPVFVAVVVSSGILLMHRRLPREPRVRWGTAASLLIVIGASLAYSALLQTNGSRAWGNPPERAYRAFYAIDSQTNPLFWQAFKANLPADAPKCLHDYPATPLDWYGMAEYGRTRCGPAGLEWIEDNYFGMMLHVYFAQPRTTGSYFARTAALAALPQGQAVEVVSVSPPIVDAFIYSEPSRDFRNVPLFYLALFLVATAALILRMRACADGWRTALAGSGSRVTLILIAFTSWLAFFLSFFDHPAAANRKEWPFYFLAVITTVAVLILALRKKRPDDPKPVGTA